MDNNSETDSYEEEDYDTTENDVKISFHNQQSIQWKITYKTDVEDSLINLKINHEKIKLMPKWLKEETNLQCLDLGSNCLEMISPENLPESLVILLLKKNNIKQIPNISLTMLKKLDLSSNSIESIDDSFINLKQLEILYLSNNCFNAITNLQQIYYLVNLKELDLSYNPICTIDPLIGNLTQLIVLDLTRTKISSLPSSISNLKNLKRIQFAQNGFTSFPIDLCSLVDRLKSIDCSRNKITFLPLELNWLKKICEFNCAKNKIEFIQYELYPFINKFNIFEQFMCNGNNITCLPQGRYHWEYCYHNEFSEEKSNQLNLEIATQKREFLSLIDICLFYLAKCDPQENIRTDQKLSKAFKEKLPIELVERFIFKIHKCVKCHRFSQTYLFYDTCLITKNRKVVEEMRLCYKCYKPYRDTICNFGKKK